MNKIIIFLNIKLGSEIIIQGIMLLTEITEQVRNPCDENFFTCRVYLNLQKAFDTVNHGILLTKLKHFGIRGASYKWFQSVLRERLQYTLIIESESPLKITSHGFPQDSVLQPPLFILYINSMHNSVKNCKIQHHANNKKPAHLKN